MSKITSPITLGSQTEYKIHLVFLVNGAGHVRMFLSPFFHSYVGFRLYLNFCLPSPPHKKETEALDNVIITHMRSSHGI